MGRGRMKGGVCVHGEREDEGVECACMGEDVYMERVECVFARRGFVYMDGVGQARCDT